MTIGQWSFPRFRSERPRHDPEPSLMSRIVDGDCQGQFLPKRRARTRLSVVGGFARSRPPAPPL